MDSGGAPAVQRLGSWPDGLCVVRSLLPVRAACSAAAALPPPTPPGQPQLLARIALGADGYLVDAAEASTAHLDQAMLFGTENFPPWAAEASRAVAAVAPSLFPPPIASRRPLFDQLILNEYASAVRPRAPRCPRLTESPQWPGDGIGAHVDLPRFDDGIVSLTLCGRCTMELQPLGVGPEGAVVRVPLGPGDLLSISGAARWHWLHGIPEREADEVDGILVERGRRVSLTLRKLLVLDTVKN